MTNLIPEEKAQKALAEKTKVQMLQKYRLCIQHSRYFYVQILLKADLLGVFFQQLPLEKGVLTPSRSR